MRLLGIIQLDAFKRRHADSRGALDSWRVLVERAQWTSPPDVKDHYPNASLLADNRVIFNIKGNTYRLVVKARYQNGIVMVEWIGTHAEYDKIKF